MSAESLIYIETQYFTSQAVYRALCERMERTDLPPVEVVILLPRRMHAFFEELTMGLGQMNMLRSLRRKATETGQALGIYCTMAGGSDGNGTQTYIHSKLLMTDDRFFTIGSANCTNRSMGLDTELNLSWEADEGDPPLVRAIRRLRVSLLAEHSGMTSPAACRKFYPHRGLVQTLERIAAARKRLLRLDPEDSMREKEWLKQIAVENSAFDSERPLLEETLFEDITADSSSLFTRGILLLNDLFSGARRSVRPEAAGKKTSMKN
jgi:phosphatidylserine/phosphatidylglycerophosphate/cardiolipin synthase-like enzyme